MSEIVGWLINFSKLVNSLVGVQVIVMHKCNEHNLLLLKYTVKGAQASKACALFTIVPVSGLSLPGSLLII
jgi:hypothetical protein